MTLHCNCNKHVSLNNVLITFEIELLEFLPKRKEKYVPPPFLFVFVGQIPIHNVVKCIYCRRKKEKEFMKNVIRSMSSISIDHMGFFTWALTSIVFDHIC